MAFTFKLTASQQSFISAFEQRLLRALDAASSQDGNSVDVQQLANTLPDLRPQLESTLGKIDRAHDYGKVLEGLSRLVDNAALQFHRGLTPEELWSGGVENAAWINPSFLGQLKQTISLGSGAITAATLLNHHQIAVCCNDGSLRIFEVNQTLEERPVWQLNGTPGKEKWPKVASAGAGRVAFGVGTAVQLWDPSKPAADGPLWAGPCFGGVVRRILPFSNDLIASVSDHGYLALYDTSRPPGQPIWHGTVPSTDICASALLQDQHLAISEGQKVWLFDRTQPQGSIGHWCSGNLSASKFTARIRSLLALHDGRLAAGCDDGRVYLIDPKQPTGAGQVWNSADLGRGAVTSLCLAPDGSLAAGTNDGTIVGIDLNQPCEAEPIWKFSTGGVSTVVTLSAVGNRWLVAGTHSGELHVFE